MSDQLTDRRGPAAIAGVFSALSCWLAFQVGVPRLISESGGTSGASEEGIGRGLAILKALEGPAIALGVAVLVLALIAGGVMLVVGSQRGTRQIGFAVLGGIVLACAGGIGK